MLMLSAATIFLALHHPPARIPVCARVPLTTSWHWCGEKMQVRDRKHPEWGTMEKQGYCVVRLHPGTGKWEMGCKDHW